jgi:F0F1-type ATP synthase assembly protein I
MAPRPNDAWSGFGTGWAATGTLLAGILVWGGIGWLVDRLAGTEPWFMAIGMLVGAGSGIYLVYVKFGKDQGGS